MLAKRQRRKQTIPPCGAEGQWGYVRVFGWGTSRNVKLSIHQWRQGGAVREH